MVNTLTLLTTLSTTLLRFELTNVTFQENPLEALRPSESTTAQAFTSR